MSKPINLYLLTYPDALPSAIYGIKDLFTIANGQANQNLFTVTTLTAETQITTYKSSIIFIPPCLSMQKSSFSDPELHELLTRWHDSGAVLVAACAGVFWLAHAGLLNGKHATTHWQLCQLLAEQFPEIKRVSSHEMIVDQGDIITAAGLYAFQDLALHIIARFSDYSLAKKVANFCLLDLKGRLQAYYQRFYPSFSHGDSLMIKAQQFCTDNIYSSIQISQLAEHCNISIRSLLRRFKLATNYSPKQYIIQLKIEKAKQLMELEKMSIEKISAEIGYSDTSNFVKTFKKIAGVTPAEFRSRHVR